MSELTRLWYSTKIRTNFYQVCLVLGILFLAVWVVDTSATNLEKLGIKTGLEFLSTEAGFSISQTLIPFSSTSTYGDAIVVCILNTILLSVTAIFLSTILGFFIAISKLSDNWLLNRVASIYVEIFRNIPLLLQLFFWYFAVLKLLPNKRESISFADVAFLNIEGLVIPSPIFWNGSQYVLYAIIFGIFASVARRLWA